MKMQRFALILLVLNLVLLTLFLTQRRAAAGQAIEPVLRVRTLELVDGHGRVRSRLTVVKILARRAPLAGRKTTSITLTGADGRQRIVTP